MQRIGLVDQMRPIPQPISSNICRRVFVGYSPTSGPGARRRCLRAFREKGDLFDCTTAEDSAQHPARATLRADEAIQRFRGRSPPSRYWAPRAGRRPGLRSEFRRVCYPFSGGRRDHTDLYEETDHDTTFQRQSSRFSGRSPGRGPLSCLPACGVTVRRRVASPNEKPTSPAWARPTAAG